MPVSIWYGSCLINEISYQWATLRSVIFDFCLWIPWLSSVPLFPILCWLIIYCGCVHAYRFKNLLKLEAFLTWWFWVKNSRSICILFCVTHRRYSLCRIQVAVNERSLLCSVLFRALLCCKYISIENLQLIILKISFIFRLKRRRYHLPWCWYIRWNHIRRLMNSNSLILWKTIQCFCLVWWSLNVKITIFLLNVKLVVRTNRCNWLI